MAFSKHSTQNYQCQRHHAIAKHIQIVLKSCTESLRQYNLLHELRTLLITNILRGLKVFQFSIPKPLLTVALSSTLMEYGSATLCFLSACSNSCKGGRSHFPKTTRSISLDKKNTAWNPWILKHNTLPKNTVKPAFHMLQVVQGDHFAPCNVGSQ